MSHVFFCFGLDKSLPKAHEFDPQLGSTWRQWNLMRVLVRDFSLCGCVIKGNCDILVILFDFPAMKSAGFLCHMVLLWCIMQPHAQNNRANWLWSEAPEPARHNQHFLYQLIASQVSMEVIKCWWASSLRSLASTLDEMKSSTESKLAMWYGLFKEMFWLYKDRF